MEKRGEGKSERGRGKRGEGKRERGRGKIGKRKRERLWEMRGEGRGRE